MENNQDIKLNKNIGDYSEKEMMHIMNGLSKRLGRLRNKPTLKLKNEVMKKESSIDTTDQLCGVKEDKADDDLESKNQIKREQLINDEKGLTNDKYFKADENKLPLKEKNLKDELEKTIEKQYKIDSAPVPIIDIEQELHKEEKEIRKLSISYSSPPLMENVQNTKSPKRKISLSEETIVVTNIDCRFDINKNNLIAMSPFIEWMIKRSDRLVGDICELNLSHLGIATNIIRSIFVYVNTSKTVLDISHVSAPHIFKAAALLEMQDLRDSVKAFMGEESYKRYLWDAVPSEAWLRNIITDLWPLVKRENWVSLIELCECYLAKHYHTLIKYPSSFLQLSFEQICHLLRRDDLCAFDEREVYESAVLWYQINNIDNEAKDSSISQTSESKDCEAMSNLIRYSQMNAGDLFLCINPTMQRIFPVKEDILLNANWYIVCRAHGTNKSIQDAFTTIGVKPRQYTQNLCENERVTFNIIEFNEKTIARIKGALIIQNFEEVNKLIELKKSEQKTNVLQPGSTSVGDEEVIVVISGSVNETPLLTQIYNPKGNIWAKNLTLTKTPFARKLHQIAFVQGSIYVIGGYEYVGNKSKPGKPVPVNTVHKYRCGIWEKINSMHKRRIYHSLAVLNQYIYAIGGQDEDGSHLSSVERLDTKREVWDLVSSLSSPRLAIACATHNDCVWAVGGFENETEKTASTLQDVASPIVAKVECYNPVSNKWSRKKDMRFPRCHASLIEVKNRLYICGGATLFARKSSTNIQSNSMTRVKSQSFKKSPTTITSMPVVDVYLDDLDTWTYVTGLKIPRHRAGIASLGSKVYIFGGVSSLSNSELNSVECYDVEKSGWSSDIEPLPLCSLGPVCCRVPLSCL